MSGSPTSRVKRVVRLEQQPLLLASARLRADEVPAALQALAVQREGEMALGVGRARVAFRRPAALVPDDHGAAAVLALGDRALEGEVLQRMVLRVDREALLPANEARAPRHRPALENAVELQPEIVVEAARVVLLDDEAEARRASPCAPSARG